MIETIIAKLFTKEKIVVWIVSGALALAGAGFAVNTDQVKDDLCKTKVEEALKK